MKEYLSKITLGTSFIILLFGSTNIFVQEENIEIGPWLVYGGQLEKLGISVDGYYSINEQFRTGVGLTYYLPEKTTIGGTEYTSNFFYYRF